MSSPKDPKKVTTSTQWVLQIEGGRQVGPLTTDEVLKRISEGLLTGEERIRQYPDGKWTVVSRKTEFYDKLLETLEGVVHHKAGPQVPPKPVPSQLPSAPPPVPVEFSRNQDSELTQPSMKIDIRESPSVPHIPAPASRAPKIPMPKVPPPPDKGKDVRLPIAIVVGALLVIVISFFFMGEKEDEKPRLLLPRSGTSTSLSEEEQKKVFAQAMGVFLLDSFEGYFEAQKILIKLIEGAPQNAEPRGILCLVYKELWPYVPQDSKDLEAVQIMTKATRSLDPVGLNGIFCEVSQLMVMGKYFDARGTIEHTLEQNIFSSSSILYSLKAEIVGADKDEKQAAIFAKTAAELSPGWVKPHYQAGTYFAQSQEVESAQRYFEEALKLNPKHRSSMIEYGALLYEKLQKADVAVKYLQAGATSKSKIPRRQAAKAHYLLAQIFSSTNQQTKALEHAEMAFKLSPSDGRVKNLLIQLGGAPDSIKKGNQNNELVLLGDQYYRSGDCFSAQAEYKAAFELDKTNALSATKAARCLWQLNQGQEAIQWLNRAIKADPKLALAYYLEADYYSQRFNYAAAIQVLNLGSKYTPNNVEILRGYGLVELRRNNVKDAVGFLQRALKVYESDAETLIILARAFLVAMEIEKAQKVALRAVELDPINHDAQVIYAKSLVQMRGLEAGLTYLKDLINKFSYTVEYRLALAETYKEAERSHQAEEIYAAVTLADPKNKKAVMGLAESYQAQGKLDKALKTFLSASILDPSDAEPLFKAGLVLYEASKYKEAIREFQRALQVNSIFPRGHYYVGKAAFANGQFQLALDESTMERKLNPSLADAYSLAAEVYMATRDYTKCSSEYQQVVRLRPQGADTYIKLARCNRLAGNLDIAESMLNIASSQESGLAEIYKEQGAIFEQKGDGRAAAQAYSKYLALSPNAPDRKQIDERIQSLGGGN